MILVVSVIHIKRLRPAVSVGPSSDRCYSLFVDLNKIIVHKKPYTAIVGAAG